MELDLRGHNSGTIAGTRPQLGIDPVPQCEAEHDEKTCTESQITFYSHVRFFLFRTESEDQKSCACGHYFPVALLRYVRVLANLGLRDRKGPVHRITAWITLTRPS